MTVQILQNGDIKTFEDVVEIKPFKRNWLFIKTKEEYIDVRFFKDDEIRIVRW